MISSQQTAPIGRTLTVSQSLAALAKDDLPWIVAMNSHSPTLVSPMCERSCQELGHRVVNNPRHHRHAHQITAVRM
jgi:hypothetical protein